MSSQLISGQGNLALAESNSDDVVIFAASSLTRLMQQMQKDLENELPHLRISYAASAQLARQIEFSAPADIFISANKSWIDYLRRKNKIQSTDPILENSLSLVTHRDNAYFTPKDTNLQKQLENYIPYSLAIGNPMQVPLGQYSEELLTKLGVWKQLNNKIALGGDANKTRLLVETKQSKYGILYHSDTVNNNHLMTLEQFNKPSDPRVTYWLSVIKKEKTSPNTQMVLSYFQSSDFYDLAQKYGFLNHSETDY